MEGPCCGWVDGWVIRHRPSLSSCSLSPSTNTPEQSRCVFTSCVRSTSQEARLEGGEIQEDRPWLTSLRWPCRRPVGCRARKPGVRMQSSSIMEASGGVVEWESTIVSEERLPPVGMQAAGQSSEGLHASLLSCTLPRRPVMYSIIGVLVGLPVLLARGKGRGRWGMDWVWSWF